VDFETGLSTIVENAESDEPTDWLHRNDNYVPQHTGPRTVLTGPLPTFGQTGDHKNLVLLLNKKHFISKVIYKYMLLYLFIYFLKIVEVLSGPLPTSVQLGEIKNLMLLLNKKTHF